MALKIESRAEDDARVVTLQGKLIFDYRAPLHDEIKRLMAEGARRVLVDLAGVDYIDSHGLGQMVTCHTSLRREGGQVRFVGLRPKIKRLLEMTSIPSILEFDSDVASGLRALSAPGRPAGET